MTKSQATLSSWLDYAWNVASAVVRSDHHIEECRKGGGSPPLDGVPEALCRTRLPGYVGADYESGRGVLLVGAAFKSAELVNPNFFPALEAASLWVAEGRDAESDIRFLATTRAAYEASMPGWWSWPRFFEATLKRIGLGISETAYVNVAKCWYSWRGYQDRNLAKSLASKCENRFITLQSLVEAIQPRQVYVAAASAPHPVPSGATRDVYVMNLTNRSVRGLEPWPDWLDQVNAAYRAGDVA